MKVLLHKNFLKGYKKLSKKEKERFRERRDIFLINPFDFILNNHKLKGRYEGCRSINITGNLRVLYKEENDLVIFFKVDIHSNLYE